MSTVKPITLTRHLEGELEVGGIDLTELAQTYGTPLYVLDEATLRDNCRAYTAPLSQHYPNYQVVFAGKAGLNKGILNLIAEEGLGVDVVSGGELYTALKSDVSPDKILFHGNNKSLEEISMALDHQIRIVVDNGQELKNIQTLCQQKACTANLLVRLKPEIEAHTHDYIKTGHIDSKFGIDKRELIDIISFIVDTPELKFLGIHGHIGSQIFDVEPYLDLVRIMVCHLVHIKSEVGVEVEELNLGGGIGIRYIEQDDPPAIDLFIEKLTTLLKEELKKAGLKEPKLILEPGRSIIGNAGLTLYTVGAVKPIPGIKDYVFVDGGMADNPRPMLYQAEYTFELANKAGKGKPYTIAGKYCESGDVLAEGVLLPEPSVGDVLAVYGTGAYNYAMASNYNRCQRPAMVGVFGGHSRVLVRRETYDDVIRYDL